jgi:hypothetical protein
MIKRLIPLLLSALALMLGFAALSAPDAGASVAWKRFVRAAGRGRINDIAGPSSRGLLTTSAGIHLWHVGRNKRQVSFVKPHGRGGRIGYLPDHPKVEPYIVQVPAAHCPGLHRGDIWGLSGPRPHLVRVTTSGRVKRGMSLPRGLEPSGITFDTTGSFGHALLVTERNRAAGTSGVLSICGSERRWITQALPRVEGGIVVAPSSFDGFSGWLLAANEVHSNIYAISPAGAIQELGVPADAPVGGDIGIESLGVVPSGLDGRSAAYLSDRYTPGNIRRGSGVLLRLGWPTLAAAGVQAGDVLAATEGGALTYDIRCSLSCSAQLVAHGAARAHIEGHIIFARRLGRA